MKTKILQLAGIAFAALLAVSCTTDPYYSGYNGSSGAPYQNSGQGQLHPNTVPLIATGVAALALYGYSKERSDRKKHNAYYHGSRYNRGYHTYPNRSHRGGRH